MQLSLAPRTISLPACLPPALRARLAGQPARLADGGVVRVPKEVRRRVELPEQIRVSEWAAKHRRVTDGAHEGPWRHEYAPHLVHIMDRFGEPWVREIWFCGVEQSGKTNVMLNCLGWALDCDPGNVFYLMPTEDTAAKITGGKIKPMLAASRRLARLQSSRQDDTSLARIRLRHGATIFPAHANSASSMASWAAKHCFGDEVDKYPPMAGKEADPITLIKKRNRTYRGRYKRFFASTPAGRFIQAGVRSCHQVWEARERCPHCQQLVRLTADNLVLEAEATPETVERDGCQVSCPACGAVWTESERLQAIRTGRWVATKGGDLTRPERVGYWHRAWDCLDIPLAEIAAACLRSKHGDLAAKTAWANGYEAEDYEHQQQDRLTETILRLRDDAWPRGLAPRDPASVVIVADTQKHGFFYQVWAIGQPPEWAPVLVDHGFLEEFDHLANLAAREWMDADGQPHQAKAAFIDSGGGTDPHRPKHSRTTAVYEFCRRNPLWKPLKGQRRQTKTWTVSRQDHYPSRSGKKIPIPGGLNLYLLDVTHYKNDLAHKLLIEPHDPGAIRLHAEVGEDFAQQLCAEYQDEHGWWECPRNKPNHHWDCAVYLRAAIDIHVKPNHRARQTVGRRVRSTGIGNLR